jgi:hypothetical protein
MPTEEIRDNRESVPHMLSEFLRELSALILVFVPLDYLLKGDQPGWNFWAEVIGVAIASSLLLAPGIIIERSK